MAVEVRAVYEGQLRCRLTHGPSGQEFVSDAPVDNQGLGEAFSPTDLVAAALGSCILTTMGIVAERHHIDVTGATATVLKEMVTQPFRRIGRLTVTIRFSRTYPDDQRQLLERTAMTCPVHRSLHPDVEAPVQFVYPS